MKENERLDALEKIKELKKKKEEWYSSISHIKKKTS